MLGGDSAGVLRLRPNRLMRLERGRPCFVAKHLICLAIVKPSKLMTAVRFPSPASTHNSRKAGGSREGAHALARRAGGQAADVQSGLDPLHHIDANAAVVSHTSCIRQAGVCKRANQAVGAS